MNVIDYDEPEAEAEWLVQQRANIKNYFFVSDVQHSEIAKQADWFVAPYVSVWRVQSMVSPGDIGWWAISGDLPTDYISANDAANAREALSAFASRWQEVSGYMLRDEDHPTIRIGGEDQRQELGDLLSRRARIIEKWAQDDDLWS